MIVLDLPFVDIELLIFTLIVGRCDLLYFCVPYLLNLFGTYRFLFDQSVSIQFIGVGPLSYFFIHHWLSESNNKGINTMAGLVHYGQSADSQSDRQKYLS